MFVSDNTSPACPEVMQAIAEANVGDATGYGGDEATAELGQAFSRYFGIPVAAFPVGTGTAANAIALSLAAPRFAAIYCHQFAHIETTECGAAEAWGGGTKLVTVSGTQGRLNADSLRAKLSRVPRGRPQTAVPAVVSITQGSEAGTIYTLSEIAEISAVAHEHGMKVHMDGARFSNALMAINCTPAEMTWKAGVDVLSYGATKNGAMGADGVIAFDQGLIEQAAFLQRRYGQLYSKMRYLSVQLLALLRDGIAERNADHANKMGQRLARGLAKISGARLLYAAEINEVFISLPDVARDRLAVAGYTPQLRTPLDEPHCRFVTAWDTDQAMVDRFIDVATGGRGFDRPS